MVKYTTNSVFHDLGFKNDEALILQFKSELLIKIKEIVETKDLKRRDLEKILDVPQPRVSDLMTGKIDRFSIEILILFLSHLGVKVALTMEVAY